MYEQKNVNNMTNSFIEKLMEHLNRNTHFVKVKKNEQTRKKWITPSLLKAINKKNNLYIQLKKSPNDTNLKSEYIRIKNEIRKLINTSKKNYLQEIIKNSQSESKAIWKCMNGICGNSNEQKMEIEHIKCEGTLIREEKEIANKFNEYFTGVGKLYAEKIDSPNEFEEVDISQ